MLLVRPLFFTLLLLGLWSLSASPLTLQLQKEVILEATADARNLFANGYLLAGKFKSLDLEPGYHYLTADDVRDKLISQNPNLERFPIVGEGIKVFIQKSSKIPSLPNQETPAWAYEKNSPPAQMSPEESKYFFLINKNLEGLKTLKRGTSLILALDQDSLSLQLHGILVSDWNIGSKLRIKLQHSEKVIEECPSNARILYF